MSFVVAEATRLIAVASDEARRVARMNNAKESGTAVWPCCFPDAACPLSLLMACQSRLNIGQPDPRQRTKHEAWRDAGVLNHGVRQSCDIDAARHFVGVPMARTEQIPVANWIELS